MIKYGRQQIDKDDIQAVLQALNSDFITSGPLVEDFESCLARHTKANFVIACANGAAALHLACLGAGLCKGTWAIVPTVSFLATANAVRYCDADVLFCDVDPNSGIMTTDTFIATLEKAEKMGLNVRAVLPVHLTGRPVNLKKLKAVCVEKNIKIIADSCHAIGGEYEGTPIGSALLEDFSTFSFHPVKTITTGEGGAITTNNEEAANWMRLLRNQSMEKDNSGLPWHYDMKHLGYNYRLTDFQCALGISQLKKIDKIVEKRNYLVNIYNELIEKCSPTIKTHEKVSPNEKIGWHLYAASIDFGNLDISRAILMSKLADAGINTQVHYIPIHTQPYYRQLYGHIFLPGAEKYFNSTLSLPLYPQLSKDDLSYIVEKLQSFIN